MLNFLKWNNPSSIFGTIHYNFRDINRSSDLVDKMSALQPRDRGFESHTGHDHDSINIFYLVRTKSYNN